MTSRIFINIEADTASEAREQMRELLHGPVVSLFPRDEIDDARENEQRVRAAGFATESDLQPEEEAAAPKRERGQPSPGKARRTKAEIAEDDEVTALAKTCEIFETQLDEAIAEHGHSHVIEKLKALAAEKPAISTTPEDRQDPANPEPADDEATAAADAADEAAETAAARGDNPALTLEDIRNVLGKYQQAYGVEATMIDGPLVLSEVCGDGVVKVSQVADDKVGAVIEALKKAGRENRFGRAAVAA